MNATLDTPATASRGPTFKIRGAEIDKSEHYDWQTVGKPGKFMMIDKDRIKVDHSYQREQVNEARVLRIARELCWIKFGVLTLVLREDGWYYCIDGQHRYLAAMRRSDLTKLPCLVFSIGGQNGTVHEAEGFLKVNCDRGSVKLFDKINALIVANDPSAKYMSAMIRGSGYKLAPSGGHAKNSVSCIGTIYKAIVSDHAAAEVAWRICMELYAGDSPSENVYKGLFTLERAMRACEPLRSLLDPDNMVVLKRLGHKALAKSIDTIKLIRESAGPRVCAEGVASAINAKRRKDYVPNMAPGGK